MLPSVENKNNEHCVPLKAIETLTLNACKCVGINVSKFLSQPLFTVRH